MSNQRKHPNLLIAEYYGYKLQPCRNGKAWESPFFYAKEDILHIHGRLFSETGDELRHLDFANNWELLVPLASSWIENTDIANLDVAALTTAILRNDKAACYKSIIDCLTENRLARHI